MSIWNKILVGLISVAAVAFFCLATRTLKTHQYWREKADRFEQAIEQTGQDNKRLVWGDPETGEMGIKRLRLELRKTLIDRGRVWYNCTPKPNAQTAQTGQVTVGTDLPDPHGIAANTVLFVFEEADVEQGGRYLGEFKVTAVDQQEVVLEPARIFPPGPPGLQQLAASNGPWALYENMPADDHQVFAGMDATELEKLLPGSSLEEYVRSGQEATWEEMDAWGVDGLLFDEQGTPLLDAEGNRLPGARGVYRRWLRDYEVLFKDYEMQLTVLYDKAQSLAQDLQYLNTAVAEAERQEQFREKEKVQLQADKDKYEREMQAAADLHQALEDELKAKRAEIDGILKQNKDDADEIARIQAYATRRINARAPITSAAGGGVD